MEKTGVQGSIYRQMKFIEKFLLALPSENSHPSESSGSRGMPGWKANPQHTRFTWLWVHSVSYFLLTLTFWIPRAPGDRRPQGHPTFLGLAQKQVLEQVDSGLNLALHKLRAHVWGCDRIEKDLAATCKVTPTFKSQRSIWTRTGGCPALGDNLFQAELTSLKIHNSHINCMLQFTARNGLKD